MPPQQPRPYLYWIIIFLLVLYIIPASFLAFRNFKLKNPLSSQPGSIPQEQLFESQTAIITGKVTAISENSIEVENSRGIKGTVELAQNFTISDMFNPLATPSGDIKRIPTGKDVQIILNFIDGKYQAITINLQQIYSAPQLSDNNSTQDNPTPATRSAVPPIIPSVAPVIVPSPINSSANP